MDLETMLLLCLVILCTLLVDSGKKTSKLCSADMSSVGSLAKQNEFYSKNHLGRVRCTLCDAVCRDEANFIVHLDAKKHKANLGQLEKAKARFMEDQAERIRLRELEDQQKHEENAKRLAAVGAQAGSLNADISSTAVTSTGGTIGLPPPSRAMAALGQPKASFRTEPQPELARCRVWFDVRYPAASETAHPMHRWMSAREQAVQIADDSVKYLVFACEDYQTIAYTFPNIPHTDSDTKDNSLFSSEWDPIGKVYRLYFVMG